MWGPSDSRFLDVEGYKIYTRTFGGRNKNRTLVCAHGGPGATHDYLLPLSDLVRAGYRVVFYDALGCGRSDLPDGHELFTLEHDLVVLEKVRQSLGVDRIHLMGSSYGGLLVLAYATRHSQHLTSLISTGGLTDVPFATREMRRLVRALPKRTQATLRKFERRGEFQHPEYEAAVMQFYRRHLCRLWPWPEDVQMALARISRPVYGTMNGPNEFTIVGNIKDINFSRDLSSISVPTLLIHGRYDEVTPAVGERIHHRIPGSRLHIFPRSSHVSFWEERPAYMRLVREFMRQAEGRSSR
ncbi:MAG TPA: proline iminopeptidase-family hydrolase [Thermoplasmata archaeon]|nr:proline iminopeptidase-family hydrolase [Thermoplasmata archaeon]